MSMARHQHARPGNAEITVDYDKETVSFAYPNQEHCDALAYFSNSFYQVFGFLWGAIAMLLLAQRFLPFYAQNRGSMIVVTCWLLLLYIFGARVLFGYISLAIHKFSPAARKAYPKTNAIVLWLKKKKVVDLGRKFGKHHYIDRNKLIIFNYDIALFRYKYEGEAELARIQTRSVEPADHKGEHYRFIAIFTFKEAIRSGRLTYW